MTQTEVMLKIMDYGELTMVMSIKVKAGQKLSVLFSSVAVAVVSVSLSVSVFVCSLSLSLLI